MVREYDDLEQGAYVEGYHSTDSRRVDDVDPLLTIQVPVPNNDPSLSSSSTTSHSWKRFGSRLLPKKNPFGRRSSNKKRRSKNNHHNQKEHTPLLHLTSLMKRGKGRRSGTPSKLPNNNAPSSLTENGNGSDQSRRPMPQQHNKERATKHWNAVRQHLKNGDFILQGVACKAPESSENDDDNHPHDHPHDVIVQQAIEDIRKGMEFHLDHCVIAIVVYLAISILCYNFFLQPEWTIVDSCYFSVTTFTTVGYGDEIPTTPASMIFTCIYAMVGVTCLGIALGIIGSNLMDAQDRIKKKADTLMQTKALSFFGEQEQDDDDDDTLEEEEDAQREASRCGCCFTVFGQLPLLALLLVLAFFIGYESGWNSLKTIYYLIITACTIGYGDLTPTTEKGKLVAIFFIPLAVGSMGVWLGNIANWIMEARSSQFRRQLRSQDLTQRDLDIMDDNQDGHVTRAEFLEFMLVAMNKIDESLVQELRQHFDQLDYDGTGDLTRDDLVTAARRKLTNPKNKMRLAVYKQRLLEQAANNRSRRGGFAQQSWGGFMGNGGSFLAQAFANRD